MNDEYRYTKQYIREPWVSLFMNGENEHGIHFLPVKPYGLAEDEYIMEDESKKMIYTQAKSNNYLDGCSIIVSCVFIESFEKCFLGFVNIPLTKLIHGSPEEQGVFE